MASGIRSNLARILPLLKQRIMDKASLPAERCLVLARPMPRLGQADQVAWLRPRGEVEEPGFDDGAGRGDTRYRATIELGLRTRLAFDEATQDLEFLTNASLGHLRMERLIRNAVHGWIVEDSAGDLHTDHPIRVRRLEAPDRPSEQDWGETLMELELEYEYDFDQDEQ